MTIFKLDTGRTQRAKSLSVKKIGPRQFKVGRHYVDLNESTPCHCEDMLLSKKPPTACKHMIAAKMYEDGL